MARRDRAAVRRDAYPEVSEIFVVPLLDGGFAFGYPTAIYKTTVIAHIVDFLGATPEPPVDLGAMPLLTVDCMVGSEFMPEQSTFSFRWRRTGVRVANPAPISNRYVQMGVPPHRVDLLGQLPNEPIPAEQVANYPFHSLRSHNTERIEIALKRLEMSLTELAEAWREGKLATRPGADPLGADPLKKRRGSKKREPPRLRIAIPLPGGVSWPSASDLARRHAVEDAIKERELGTVTDTGAGLGVMEVILQPADARTSPALKEILRGLGLTNATVTPVDPP